MVAHPALLQQVEIAEETPAFLSRSPLSCLIRENKIGGEDTVSPEALPKKNNPGHWLGSSCSAVQDGTGLPTVTGHGQVDAVAEGVVVNPGRSSGMYRSPSPQP